MTQGCRPISPWAVVTATQDNLLLELDGVPALDVLLETLDVTLEGDTQPAIQAVNSTMAGVLDVGAPQPHNTGHIGANTRALHIVGLDATRRGVALAEQVQPGTWMTFCQRHQSAARADLMRICAEIREEVEPDEDVLPAHGSTTLDSTAVYGRMQTPRRILGAVYISCSDRSGHFFGGTSAELQIVRRALGDVPLVGFFAHGEIAEHRLYGYTGVLTVFVE
ncbi:hypothetical protein SDC9_62757 [bioreactor metagenome]|uniref:FIST C-domain domain-containing protein n=1 Tax=bioreactor metagenome TaxID=1076179 RepID=A0A644XKU5_9ZZZZ